MTTQNCVWGHICPLSMRLADVSKPTGGLLAAGTLVLLSFHHKQGLNPRQTPSRGDLDRTQPVEPLGQWAVALGLVSWKGPTLQPARQLAPHCHHPRKNSLPSQPTNLLGAAVTSDQVGAKSSNSPPGRPSTERFTKALPPRPVLRPAHDWGIWAALCAAGASSLWKRAGAGSTCQQPDLPPLLPCPCCDRHHHRGH